MAFSAVLALTLVLLGLMRNLGQGKPEIDFFDVGQGDSSLIKVGGKTVLIDGGPDNIVLKRLGENLPYFKRRIDYVFISHFHDDHISGLFEVIRRYQIGEIIYMRGAESSELMDALLKMAEAKHIKILALPSQANLNLGSGCSFFLLNPYSLYINKDANNSLVAKLNCSSFKALFTGDDNAAVEAALIKTGKDWSGDFFKAAHHGSKTANSAEFLRAVNPRLIVISVGALNRFGHPSQEIIERLSNMGFKFKRTDQIGTVKINE